MVGVHQAARGPQRFGPQKSSPHHPPQQKRLLGVVWLALGAQGRLELATETLGTSTRNAAALLLAVRCADLLRREDVDE